MDHPSSSSPVPEYKPTKTQEDQWVVQSQIFHIYNLFCNSPPNLQAVMLEVQRDNHIEYLMKGLRNLGPSFVVLDANRPWLCYWILHSLALLRECVDVPLEHNAIDFLSRCQDEHGGYGGGPGQMPHLCTTYAAVNSLITLGGHRSLKSINRAKIYSYLRRMKHTSGGFSMHDGGEVDVRACYTAISVASVLNILDEELTQGVGNYILRPTKVALLVNQVQKLMVGMFQLNDFQIPSVETPVVVDAVKVQEPIPLDQQRELFKWILDEKGN